MRDCGSWFVGRVGPLILGPTIDGGAVLVGVEEIVAVAVAVGVGKWLEIGATAAEWVAVRTDVAIVGWPCGYAHTQVGVIELSDLK